MPTTLQNTNVLFNDSSTQGTAWTGNRGQVFTSNGTFTIPTGVTALKITVVGGGGGTGGYTVSGGAGGGAAIKFLTSLTPGNTLGVTVGAGGAGNSGFTGGTGGTSQVASGTQTITTVSATGGAGGTNIQAGHTGGIGSNGDLNIRGQGTSWGLVYIGCAGYVANPVGGSSILGGGGPPLGAGGAYGGGAGQNNAGGAGLSGAAGVVIFEW